MWRANLPTLSWQSQDARTTTSTTRGDGARKGLVVQINGRNPQIGPRIDFLVGTPRRQRSLTSRMRRVPKPLRKIRRDEPSPRRAVGAPAHVQRR
jgi:hypothetical protein